MAKMLQNISFLKGKKMAEDQKKGSCTELTKERPCRKCTREGSSETNEDVHEVRKHTCQRCCDVNAKLSSIKEKLAIFFKKLPEFETYKSKVNNLEQENKIMQKNIEDLQAEVEDLKSKLAAATLKLTEVTFQQEVTQCALQ